VGKFARTAVRHPVATVMFFVAVVLPGVISLQQFVAEPRLPPW
jgi:multidrug efflux pump subunit AcrB